MLNKNYIDIKEWNGIVRELIDRKADIAVASMTINFARLVISKHINKETKSGWLNGRTIVQN